MSTLADTNALVALADRSEQGHDSMRRFLRSHRAPLLVPVTVLPEADYLVTRKVGLRAAMAMLQSVAEGAFQLVPLLDADLPRCIEMMRQYADSDIGFVDASIVAIAERLGVRRILTLDRRHFGIIRPRHCDAFTLLP